MCGIFGSVGAPAGPDAVRRVAAVLHHRGPDSGGVLQLERATLVHARLRIIDLSPAAAGPMPNEDGSVWITFNGEIYNFLDLRRELEARGHRFRSHSDTEVIVHGYEEWGDRVVGRLDGMFAFGLWDARADRLLLARDRAGKKPLYYALRGDHLVFASEIKALFASGTPTDLDEEAIPGLLAYGYPPAPRTLYRHVSELLPAHHLVYRPGGLPETTRYWALDVQARDPAPGRPAAAERIRELLTEAVRKRLVADVPLGAFLSGGLDSTIVVGLMSRLGPKVRTFSIGFAGDPRYDETQYARTAAAAFGTDHTEFRVTAADFELIDRLVWHHDGPFGDSSAIPTYVVSRLTRRDVTVALNGDGGDELFAGYVRFWAAATTERIPRPLRRVAGMVPAFLPRGARGKSLTARLWRLLSAVDRPLGDRTTFWNSFFAFALDDLLRPELNASPDAVLEFHRRYFSATNGHSPLAAVLEHNFGTYLPCDLLVKMDRMSMANALETRSPFLDTALMEYVAGLPDDYKLRGRTTKSILREAFADLVPEDIQRRPKMGFGVPLGTWFRGNLRDYLRDHLAVPGALINAYVRADAVDRLLREHLEGRADHGHQLWLLLTMEIWLRNLGRLAEPWDATALDTPLAPVTAGTR